MGAGRPCFSLDHQGNVPMRTTVPAPALPSPQPMLRTLSLFTLLPKGSHWAGPDQVNAFPAELSLQPPNSLFWEPDLGVLRDHSWL